MKTTNLTKLLSAFIMLSVGLTACKKNEVPQSAKTSVNWNSARTVNEVKIQSTSSPYYTKAQETHNFVYGNLLTSYNSYSVNTTTQTTTAYEWYNISQIYADAAMVKIGSTAYAI